MALGDRLKVISWPLVRKKSDNIQKTAKTALILDECYFNRQIVMSEDADQGFDGHRSVVFMSYHGSKEGYTKTIHDGDDGFKKAMVVASPYH